MRTMNFLFLLYGNLASEECNTTFLSDKLKLNPWDPSDKPQDAFCSWVPMSKYGAEMTNCACDITPVISYWCCSVAPKHLTGGVCITTCFTTCPLSQMPIILLRKIFLMKFLFPYKYKGNVVSTGLLMICNKLIGDGNSCSWRWSYKEA